MASNTSGLFLRSLTRQNLKSPLPSIAQQLSTQTPAAGFSWHAASFAAPRSFDFQLPSMKQIVTTVSPISFQHRLLTSSSAALARAKLDPQRYAERIILSDLTKEVKAPKRPPTAYILFSKDKYKEVKQALFGKETVDGTKVTKELGGMWKAMSDAEKQKYNDEAAEQAAAYKLVHDRFMKSRTPENLAAEQERYRLLRKLRPTKTHARPKPLATTPKRPLTGYLRWTMSVRAMSASEQDKLLGTELVGMKVGEQGKVLGKVWRAMSEDAKKSFNSAAAADMEAYKTRKATYSKGLTAVKTEIKKEIKAIASEKKKEIKPKKRKPAAKKKPLRRSRAKTSGTRRSASRVKPKSKKKPAAKRPATKKTATKRTAAKKTTTRKPAAKKAVAKKPVAKRAGTKKA